MAYDMAMIKNNMPTDLRARLMKGVHTKYAVEWLDKHTNDDSITMYDHIKPMVATSDSGNPVAFAILYVLGLYNQNEWLHNRMTFHALADVQEWFLLHQTLSIPEPVK